MIVIGRNCVIVGAEAFVAVLNRLTEKFDYPRMQRLADANNYLLPFWMIAPGIARIRT